MKDIDALEQMAEDLYLAQITRLADSDVQSRKEFFDYDERIIRDTIKTFRECSSTYKK